MKKNISRTLAVLLCMALLCTGTAFAAPAEHDHDLVQTRTGVLRDEGAAEPAPEPAPEPEAPAPTSHEHQWVIKSHETTELDCTGWTERQIMACSICGLETTNMARYSGSSNNHKYVDTVIQDSLCPQRTQTKRVCSVCGDTVVVGTFGHEWGGWVNSSSCTEPDVRTCSLCGATEYRNVNRVHVWGEIQREGSCATGWTLYHVCRTCGARETTGTTSGHAWEGFNEPSDCTHTGRSGQRCKFCGTEQNVITLPATHFPNADDGDCRTPMTCSRCGAVVTAAKSSHNFSGGWKHDGESHWQVCQNPGCKATSGAAAHNIVPSQNCTQPGYCSVCGYKSGTAPYSSHDFTGGYVIASTTYHTRKCAHPGCQSVSAPESHQMPAGDHPCTETVRCVCGYPMRQGVSAHDYGPWTANGNGHSRTCRKCGFVQTGSHTGSSNGSCTSAVSCTVCGQVLVHAFSSHSFGVWIAAANGTGHYRTCTRAGCTAIESTNHSGGTATCKSPAICSACGASYGSRSTTNHVGGTEVRNYKAPAIGVAGYTGDTYCLGCGAILKHGVSIAMLSPDHTHKFGSWKSDSLHHWHECECSERSDFASHSFVGGVCSVCGAKDPDHKVCSGSLHVGGKEIRNAKPAAVGKKGYTGDTYCTACGKLISSGTAIAALAEDHVHNFSSGWKSDSTSHWHECNCGTRSAKSAHVYGANGRCAYCGALDPAAESEQEAHIHTYGALVSNGQDHWRECSVCGEQADRAHHMILDGKCMDCGYVKVDAASFKDLDESDWYYESVQRVMETGLIAGLEGDHFEPEAAVERGQAADILYRMAGSPASAGGTFEDMSGQGDYVSAIAWAADNSILASEDGVFDPEKNATVEEIIAGLQRYAAMLDGDDAPELVEDAMEWAEQNGLMAGYEQQPEPDAEATRADVAVLVANFMQSRQILSDESPTDMETDAA